MKIQNDKVIGYVFAFNIFILVLMGFYAFINTNENVWDILQTAWIFSFGWICGRISRL